MKAASDQLEAARNMDKDALFEATELRQDLLFEIELLGEEGTVFELDENARKHVESLEALDHRLISVLEAANLTLKQVLGLEPPATYSQSGRMRGVSG
ncbi:MAG: hypothetical protein QGG40_20040 [Myxococcota bacterium]|nr:hypothetical protein [Myxococcota bacterium]